MKMTYKEIVKVNEPTSYVYQAAYASRLLKPYYIYCRNNGDFLGMGETECEAWKNAAMFLGFQEE